MASVLARTASHVRGSEKHYLNEITPLTELRTANPGAPVEDMVPTPHDADQIPQAQNLLDRAVVLPTLLYAA